MRLPKPRAGHLRVGAAAVELAFLAPLLVFLFVVAVDFARVFRFSQAVTTCARNGAVYGSYSPAQAADTSGIRTAALASAADLSAGPNVSPAPGTGARGP